MDTCGFESCRGLQFKESEIGRAGDRLENGTMGDHWGSRPPLSAIYKYLIMSKTIRQHVLTEAMLSRLLPAIRDKATKTVTVGKRGEYHSDVMMKTAPKGSGWTFRGNMASDEMGHFLKHDRGYYDPKRKKFLTRAQAGGIDSQELRRPITQFLGEGKRRKAKKS